MKYLKVATPEAIQTAVGQIDQGNKILLKLIDDGASKASNVETEQYYTDLRKGYLDAVELIFEVSNALLTSYKEEV